MANKKNVDFVKAIGNTQRPMPKIQVLGYRKPDGTFVPTTPAKPD